VLFDEAVAKLVGERSRDRLANNVGFGDDFFFDPSIVRLDLRFESSLATRQCPQGAPRGGVGSPVRTHRPE